MKEAGFYLIVFFVKFSDSDAICNHICKFTVGIEDGVGMDKKVLNFAVSGNRLLDSTGGLKGIKYPCGYWIFEISFGLKICQCEANKIAFRSAIMV